MALLDLQAMSTPAPETAGGGSSHSKHSCDASGLSVTLCDGHSGLSALLCVTAN
jgi:hypothetical protein